MTQESVLVIEDDHHILELLRVCLREEGFRVETAVDGQVGLEKALSESYSLIILDIMLPSRDGWEICEELSRARPNLPVLILTAKGDETDRVLGFRLGADDYLVKPFSPRELVARVQAILRRIKIAAQKGSELLIFPGLTIDPSRFLAMVGNEELSLTRKEFELLAFLAHNNGLVFTRDQLMNHIWNYDFTGTTRTVDEHIKNLRNKIKSLQGPDSYLQTVWGVGYKFEVKK